MKKHLWVLMLFFLSHLAFSQATVDTRVYILDILSGTPVERRFFRDSLKLELLAEGYSVTNDILEADYAISCSLEDDEEDGGRLLVLTLFNAVEEKEMVSTDLFFIAKEDSYEMLPLVIRAMFAGAPLREKAPEIVTPIQQASPAPPPPPAPDAWKYKWLYLDFMGGASVRFYEIAAGSVGSPKFTYDAGIEPEIRLFTFLALQFGIHFTKDTLEYEFDDEALEPVEDSVNLLGVPVMVKYIVNAPRRFTPGLYLGGYANFPLSGDSAPPPFGVLGGVDFAIKAGPGALVVDIRYAMDIDAADDEYSRRLITLSAGYKFGFIGRRY